MLPHLSETEVQERICGRINKHNACEEQEYSRAYSSYGRCDTLGEEYLVCELFQSFDYRETADNGNCEKIYIIHESDLILNTDESVSSETESCFEETSQLAQILEIENSETYDNNDFVVDLADHDR